MSGRTNSNNLDDNSSLPLIWLGPIMIALSGMCIYFTKVENKADNAAHAAEVAKSSADAVDGKIDNLTQLVNSVLQRVSRIEGKIDAQAAK